MPRDGTHRIRTIDPDFWGHEKTLELMAREPLAVLLILGIRSAPVNDAGRFRTSAPYLKREVLSKVEAATEEAVEGWLHILSDLNFVHLYEVNGTRYGIVHDWLEWQYVRAPTKSHIPPPPKDLCRCCDPSEWPESVRAVELSHNCGTPVTDVKHREEGRGGDRRGGDRTGGDRRGQEGGAASTCERSDPKTLERPQWPEEAKALQAMPGYPFDEGKDAATMAALAEAYGQLDLAAEVRAMKAWLASNDLLPLKGVTGPRNRVRNWMKKADQYGRERRADGRHQAASRSRQDAGPREQDWTAR